MSVLCALIAWCLFKESAMHVGQDENKYLLGSVLAGSIAISWLLFYEIMALVMVFVMGLLVLCMAFAAFSWRSTIDLVLGGVLIAAFLVYERHYLKTRHKELNKNSWIAAATIFPAIAIFEESEAIAFFIGGIFMLAIATAGLLIKWKPNRSWKLGPLRYSPSKHGR